MQVHQNGRVVLQVNFMAIVYDNSTAGGNGNSTFSHTCTGSNLLLIVAFTSDSSSGTPNTCTYNGVSMTPVSNYLISNYNNNLDLFYLYAPATGSHNVVYSDSSSSHRAGMAISYTGVKQSGFPDSSAIYNGGGNPTSSVSTTVVASNCWLFGVGNADSGNNCNFSSNRTDRQSQSASSSQRGIIISDSNGTVSTGSQTYTITETSTNAQRGQVTLSIAPYVAPTNNGGFLAFIN